MRRLLLQTISASMLNLSLISLCSANQVAATLLPTSLSSKRVISAFSLSIHRSFSPFMSISANGIDMHVGYSSFRFFMNSAFSIASATYVSNQNYSSSLTITDNITLYKCGFAYCYASNGTGGAIFVSSSQITISISSCNFENCYASFAGGALYINHVILLLTSSCFYGCRSDGHHGHACYLTSNLAASYNAFLLCPNSSLSETSSDELTLYNTQFEINNVNSSRSMAMSTDGLGFYDIQGLSRVSYCTSISHPTAEVIRIRNSVELIPLSYANFVNNSAPNGLFYLESTTNSFDNCIISGLKGNLTTSGSVGSISFTNLVFTNAKASDTNAGTVNPKQTTYVIINVNLGRCQGFVASHEFSPAFINQVALRSFLTVFAPILIN